MTATWLSADVTHLKDVGRRLEDPLDSRDAAGLLAASDAAMYTSKAAVTRVA